MGDKVDQYKVILIQRSNKLDITNLVDSFSWGSDIDTLSSQLNFAISKYNNVKPQLANSVLFTNNGKLIIQGIITSLSENKSSISITVNDHAWYLNKSKLYLQFKNISVSDAVKQLCNKFHIPIGSICSMSTNVKKIYPGDLVSDILLDLLSLYTKETGVKVRMEMLGGKFRVYACKDHVINPTYLQAKSLTPFKVMDAIGDDWTISRSIEDMINSVIVNADGKLITIKDDESIQSYGLLQEVITVDSKDISKGKNEAKNLLTEKNRIPEELSITCLGDDSIIAGRSIVLSSLNNSKYLIKSASHSYNGVHTCSVNLIKGGL